VQRNIPENRLKTKDILLQIVEVNEWRKELKTKDVSLQSRYHVIVMISNSQALTSSLVQIVNWFEINNNNNSNNSFNASHTHLSPGTGAIAISSEGPSLPAFMEA
jgi:hypothetical protein